MKKIFKIYSIDEGETIEIIPGKGTYKELEKICTDKHKDEIFDVHGMRYMLLDIILI